MVHNKMKLRDIEPIKHWLDGLYLKFHRSEWIGSDPLQFVHLYKDPLDQEIVGLIAASLAYGNVASINISIRRILACLYHQPRMYLLGVSEKELTTSCTGFRHRWTSDRAMTLFLVGIQRTIQQHGSLGKLFCALDEPDRDLKETLAKWVGHLQGGRSVLPKELLADPRRGSACKRLHLYLRWMIRHDSIDPGCWPGISASRLCMPLDTHIFGIAKACGFTRRNAADGQTAREITEAFRMICPDDPVRYDFALTRPGIVDRWKPGAGKLW